MVMTTVHLMRHGEVDNPDGLLYGRLPSFGLTGLGEQMAHAVADYLVAEDHDIVNVTASPLLRAQQSAAPTAEAYDLPIDCDPRLIEAGSEFEGRNIVGDRWELARPRNWHLYRRPFLPSWGEPYQDIRSRMSAAISTAIDEASGHEALLVSHQMPIVMVQRFVQGLRLAHSPLNRRCALASLTSLHFDGRTLVSWDYAEPAAGLVARARDVSAGKSNVAQRS